MSLSTPPIGRLTARLRRRLTIHTGCVPAQIRPGRAMVSFSFDDFPISAARNGSRILQQNRLRGTFYTSSGMVGQENHLGALMREGDLARLAMQGHEIACHTQNHIDCAQTSAQQMLRDIEANHIRLARAAPIGGLQSFAWPFGEASARAKQLLAQRFVTMRGVHAGVNRGRVDRALLKAAAIDSTDPGLVRAKALIAELAHYGGWLIFFTHDVCDQPGPYGCTPSQFRMVVEAVTAANIEVQTVAKAAHKMLI
ncbi:MAG: polysaccharide deacetylase family protein [bacterium]